MTHAIVSSVLEKLASVIKDEVQLNIRLVVGAREEVKKLTTSFKVIQAVLNDAEQRQISDENVRHWLEEVKDIAYDMEDVLDEWSYEMHRSQNDTNAHLAPTMVWSNLLCSLFSCFGEVYLLRSLCSCFGQVVLHHQIGSKIKDIRERLDHAESEKNKYQLVEKKSYKKPIERLKSSSLVDVDFSHIIGRLKDKETIMSKLICLGESSTSTSTDQPESISISARHTPNIISIVGMGGLGKTTLAQLIFNDEQVNTHFEKTMWVCVSDPFDLVTVTKAIIEEAESEVPKSSEWNRLHHSLSESLKEKRFLLVLDDVWTEDQSIWESLMVSFRYGAKGSQILVTTRNDGVALMMNSIYTHYLRVLSDNDCSLLLSRKAFEGRNKENQEHLREISERISEKCKGLPLAAKTLGGLLHFKNTKKEWLSILESEIWKLEEIENGVLKPALLLSYDDLPLPLKVCFVYCSIFPKDHIIEKDFLVKLWMAQGFVKSTSGNEELEMIGDDYFNNLAMRSFFQDFSKDSMGNVISSKMHHLVHDFAQLLAKNESCVTVSNGTQILSSRVRHLSLSLDWSKEAGVHSNLSNQYSTELTFPAKLRTLRIVNPNCKVALVEAPANFFYQLRCLKVLCLNDVGLENLSSEIKTLIHLRYLDLSNNEKLKILPDTLPDLYNLQTLKLEGCECLCNLPREIRRMINLRHLDISGTDQLSHIPQGIGGLTSLRTLSDFIVGGGAAGDGCSIVELKDLNLLQGNLNIRGLGRVETRNEAFETGMKKKHLHSLMLGFKPNEETENGPDQDLENSLSKRMEDVLEVLEPHPEVLEIGVCDYLGFKLSRWIGSTSILSHMKTLKLYDCINLKKFPAFGELPSLEVLDIKRAIKVKHIGLQFYTNSLEHVNRVAFPKLKELYMEGMNNLKVWELEHGVVMPCLRRIKLVCPKLKLLPALGKLPSLEELRIFQADVLRHIGCEFLYEVDEAGGEHFNNIAFPKLQTLVIESEELEWELDAVGNTGEEIIMPCLRELQILGFQIRKPFLEVVSKMSSLESLTIRGEATEFIKYIRQDEDIDELKIMFPNLKDLWLSDMEDMEELKIGSQVMPLLESLSIDNCYNLKAIQGLSKLGGLGVDGCESLYELPFPNLILLYLRGGPVHPSLPASATILQALRHLMIECWPSLTFIPEQVQQLISLDWLELYNCGDELKQRCRKDQGEDWRIISHIPNIKINDKWVILNFKDMSS